MEREYCIYCIPHAGSGSSFFAKWNAHFDKNAHIVPLELSGREKRRNAPLCDDMRSIVDEFSAYIAEDLKKIEVEEFHLFGYSMGGVIAYELTKNLSNVYGLTPGNLFMGASTMISNRTVKISELQEDELLKYLTEIGGIGQEGFPKEYASIIKNDYRLLEKYSFDFEKVKSRIVAFASRQDQAMLYKNVRLLRFLTDDFELYEYTGNHFFIRTQLEHVIENVKYEIMKSRNC